MIASAIRFLVQNLPAVLFVFALVIAAVMRRDGPAAERFLSWILLLPIGITGLWAGAFHVFLPQTAASLIGWQVSPFQFEVGMADFAIGITACIAFWRDLSFKAGAVCAASVFPPGRRHRARETDGHGWQFCAGKCGRALLHGHYLPAAGHRSPVGRQPPGARAESLIFPTIHGSTSRANRRSECLIAGRTIRRIRATGRPASRGAGLRHFVADVVPAAFPRTEEDNAPWRSSVTSRKPPAREHRARMRSLSSSARCARRLFRPAIHRSISGPRPSVLPSWASA